MTELLDFAIPDPGLGEQPTPEGVEPLLVQGTAKEIARGASLTGCRGSVTSERSRAPIVLGLSCLILKTVD